MDLICLRTNYPQLQLKDFHFLWELGPFPHLHHLITNRGLLLSQLFPGMLPYSAGLEMGMSLPFDVAFSILELSEDCALLSVMYGSLRQQLIAQCCYYNSFLLTLLLCAMYYSTKQPKHPPALQHWGQTGGLSLQSGKPERGALASNRQAQIYSSGSSGLFLLSQELKALSSVNSLTK